MADLTLKQNDKGYAVNFTWQNADGTAKDLSGGTVSLKAWVRHYPETLTASIVCSVANAGAGLAVCVIPAGTFAASGLLDFELELVEGTTVTDSSDTYTLAVQESG